MSARRPLPPRNTRPGKPTRPSQAVRAAYAKRLQSRLDEMRASLLWWLGAEYKRQQSKIAAYDAMPFWRKALRMIARDASPANAMLAALRRRMRQWIRHFGDAAAEDAKWFASRALGQSSAGVAAGIKGATGIAVRFKSTRAMQNAMASIVAENASLITSLPQRLGVDLEGLIMRSVRSGRDLAQLTDDVESRFDVARNRAAFIAEDQNNKATEALTRVRYQELGITRVEWVHVSRSIQARKTHEDMDGRPFMLSEGLYDPAVGRKIRPGELPRCRCQYAPLLPAFAQTQADLAKYEEAANA